MASLTPTKNQIPQWKEEVFEGWWPILDQLHDDLVALDPEYQVGQLKEKFGGLRVYLVDHSHDKINQLIYTAERLSSRVCEFCGAAGIPRGNRPVDDPSTYSGWIKTTCDHHHNERVLKRIKERVTE